MLANRPRNAGDEPHERADHFGALMTSHGGRRRPVAFDLLRLENDDLRAALKAAGVEFTDDEQPGVRLRKTR